LNTWLDLEARFRALELPLKSACLNAQGGAAGEHWHLSGPMMGALPKQEFELLSAVAGAMMAKALSVKITSELELLNIPDPKIRWYTHLKQACPTFRIDLYGEQKNYDGSSAGFIYSGTLQSIAASAANQCLAMHTSHPLREEVNKWKWFHDNYAKAIVVGVVLTIVGAIAKLFIA
jgi:hypothetical protein